ncbi:response regulator [Prosthecobacter sp.]|uniref:response regulator n=1 Tax=Prosthecobacter sp. TaxID=1965333 RepID=UPI0024870C7B|nr:response regulator [Prosthecobacter sp.]MDI1312092.1 response regulator [Prosthecobacter sp.]
MNSPLRILHLEDDPADAALIRFSLETGGIPCAITCVHSHADFVAALESTRFHLILSDYTLPAFDGMAAITLVRAKWPDLPVILVSGTMGEDFAIDSLKSGATDYVLKSRLSRLVPAVRRAMQDVAERAERRQLEAQFIEAQKMEVIGQLAAGVAHDFNNILGVIMGYSDIMLMQLPPADPMRNYLEEIRRASERAAGLTLQLLVFGRKQTVQPVVIDLNVVLRDLEQMLQRLIDENISLSLVPATQPGQILADPGYIGQVLMNLVVNARDAMPNGGKLTITTSKVTLDESCRHTHPDLTPGDYMMLSVSDTGTGMTAEVKARLFEAFFTTKPAGKGTGLGLSTCHTIVQQSGGFMNVHSEPGKGTLFQVHFPCVDQPLAVAPPSAPTGPLPRGTEALLVVEDDPAVRHLAAEVLQTQGYAVLSANNGQDGLNVAHAHQGPPISLVVTDVIMPLMDGKVMAEWLKVTYPGLKVLFTSGYTDDAIAHHGVLEAGVEFLPKPYTPASLTRKVRELLDA